MYDFIKDQGQNILTLVTLLLLAYQTWVNNRQFLSLNKGYLHGTPNLVLVTPVAGAPISPDLLVTGLRFQIDLLNAGNFPLRYRVSEFCLSVGEKKHILSEDQIANPIGMLYPKQEQNFAINNLPVSDAQPHVQFSSLIGTPIKITLKISYREKPTDRLRTFDRDCVLTFAGEKYDFRWTEIRDNW